MSHTPLKKISRLVLFFTLFSILFQCTEEETVERRAQNDPKTSNPDDITSFATASSVLCSSCDYVVPPDQTTVDGKTLGLKPGDVICLNAAIKYPYINFKNLEGTASSPITITNCGGEVTIDAPGKPYVIKVSYSKHFRLTGGSVNGGFGIKLKGSKSNGLVLGPLSTNFQVDHIEAFDVGFSGIMAKTDPTCDDATIRGNFVMRDVTFDHNYIHDTGGEGFYIGHTAYAGYETACGARLPHTIENVRIYKNLVRNAGWDAIQLSMATSEAYVYQNIIENYSTKDKPAQSSGICISSGTVGECYGNFIDGGNGPGIAVFGRGDNVVHNNIILNAGAMGIFCDERTEQGPGYFFLNNTIINPGLEGIRIYSDKAAINVFSNNIVVNPGRFNSKGQELYLTTLSQYVKVREENNLYTLNINDVKFANASKSDFRLKSSSPAIDEGSNISSFNIKDDYYGSARMQGAQYDIGASEFQP